VATYNRRGLILCASSLAVVALIAAVPGSAAATPRPSLHKVQVRVDKLNSQAGDAAELYNDSRVRFAEANRRLTVVKHRLAAKQAEVDAMQSSVGQLAAAAYKSGGLDPTVQILLSDNPESFLQSAVALNQLGRQQAAVLAQVVAARQGLAAARNDVTQQRARASALAEQIKSQKHAIDTKLAEAKQLLGTLKADQLAKYNAAIRATAARGHSVASRSRTGNIPSYNGPASGRASEAIKTAYAQLGDPYVYGAAGPSAFDCSGLTMMAWARAGVQLLHYTGYQWEEGPHVPLNQLQRGDLLFYATNTSDPSTIHHVAIYIGNGMMVNAPYTGAFVRIDSMYAPGGLIGAVRPAG